MPNDKFPDMKALADYVHAKGLKLGIYTSPGPTTCGGYPASYQHEYQDAATFAEWGIDYLKYDWCSYDDLNPGPVTLEEMQPPYILMHDALSAGPRDIVYSLCQIGQLQVWTWGHEVGGKMAMVGQLIAPQFGTFFNWPLGSAMSFSILTVSLLILGIVYAGLSRVGRP